MEDKGRATVQIYGEEYTVKGEASPEYLRMLAAYIDKMMRQVAARQPRLTTARVAVLTALNIADEMSKLQEDYDTLVKLMDTEKRKPDGEQKRPDENKNRSDQNKNRPDQDKNRSDQDRKKEFQKKKA
ncbi:cell division protein ZapA [Phosphitispora fastidiosa]|uniref:cell division protein ZapA n=1 Tax=Phosphitispora fastidiosa TaxID=2837202 RepID=UPI001E48D80F|nr:cell division protein ZapA [Phosphitispora fastidiosa]MBU7007210.1 cell division protein ZapA (FtsZ GTPase activity inhibitor) [Phosphitispora fastidiosa]